MQTLVQVLQAAQAVCVFHHGMVEALKEFASAVESNNSAEKRVDDAFRIESQQLLKHVRVIPQAVELPQALSADSTMTVQELAGLPLAASVVLLPAGIRPVKDVTFCMQAFTQHNLLNPHRQLHLAVVGPQLSAPELKRVHDTMRSLQPPEPSAPQQPHIHLLPPIQRVQLLQCMLSSVAVLNSSLSEGMPNAVMEAMALGVPVVVRCNAGNLSLVQHNVTGVVFTSPEDAVAACAAAAAERSGKAPPSLGMGADCSTDHPPATVSSVLAMAAAAKIHIAQNFSQEAEAAAWVALLHGWQRPPGLGSPPPLRPGLLSSMDGSPPLDSEAPPPG